MVKFEAVFDRDYCVHIVREASIAFSFSMVPRDFQNEFETRAQALDQIRRLNAQQAKGREIALSHTETPGAFEHVADTKYGSAWK